MAVKRETINVRLESSVKQQAMDYARQHDVTLAEVARIAIKALVVKRKK